MAASRSADDSVWREGRSWEEEGGGGERGRAAGGERGRWAVVGVAVGAGRWAVDRAVDGGERWAAGGRPGGGRCGGGR